MGAAFKGQDVSGERERERERERFRKAKNEEESQPTSFHLSHSENDLLPAAECGLRAVSWREIGWIRSIKCKVRSGIGEHESRQDRAQGSSPRRGPPTD